MIYTFNNIAIDTEKFLLLTNGHKTSVEPQVFDLIVYLIQHKDQIVSREQLLSHVWQGRVVSDTSINNNIKSARKVLGDDGTQQQVIKTIHSRGYQFVATLKDVNDNADKQTTVSSKRNLKPLALLVFVVTVVVIYSLLRLSSDKETIEQPHQSNQVQQQKIIAVLPFANSKPDSDTDYLGFALANQIISDLTYLEDYTIRPAGSIRKYINQNIDPIAVGLELKVNYVVNGNYLLENNIIRLNVEMIEISNSQLVWRESMQVNYSDTFALQDMVAKQVAKGLDVKLSGNAMNKQHRDIPNSALAYEYYLRGISYPMSNEGHKLAVEMLLKSIELDPDYAPSYAHLGFHRRLLEQHGRVVPTGLKKSEWYYQKALELNPNHLETLSNLSALYVETNRIEEALLITRKMLNIDPNNANTHFAQGYIYRYAGMLDEAIIAMETALEIDPNNIRFRSIISTYISAGKYEEALANIYLDPGDYGTGYAAMIAFDHERFQQARELFNQVIQIDKNGIWGLISEVHLAVMDGNMEQGKIALSKMVDTNVTDAENMYYFASFYALLKETESSLNMLEKAVDSGYFNYPNIIKTSAFNYFHDNNRYQSILNKAKKRHDDFRLEFL